MLEGDIRTFLESGCGLVVGLVRPDGVPFPTRAWGLDVIDPGTVRVILGAGELGRSAIPPGELAGAAVAVTGSDVLTLHTVQLKGEVVDVETVSADQLERTRRHIDAFFDVIVEFDRIPRERLERMVPVDFVALRISVAEAYDQTPGPGAGAPIVPAR